MSGGDSNLSQPERAGPEERGRPGFPGGQLRPAEVRELWFFLHGDVMEGGIREHLRSALGLCPRHSWAYAVVEVEQWQFGPGLRGGHQPFDVCVLYDDLLGTVIRRLTSRHLPWHRSLERELASRASCRVCDAIDGPASALSGTGFAGSDTATLSAEANRLEFTTRWLVESESVWRLRSCLHCADPTRAATATVPDSNGRSELHLLCRPHLLERGHLTPDDAAVLASGLGELRSRVASLLESMTAEDGKSTPQEDASWIEAVSWFAGWEVPYALVAATRRTGDGPPRGRTGG